VREIMKKIVRVLVARIGRLLGGHTRRNGQAIVIMQLHLMGNRSF
jgi:hypothetical protein